MGAVAFRSSRWFSYPPPSRGALAMTLAAREAGPADASITDIETIAGGRSIRQLARLRRQHGPGRWRKLKGIATVRIASGELRRAEIHWYEAHGIGRVRHKIKRFLD